VDACDRRSSVRQKCRIDVGASPSPHVEHIYNTYVELESATK
jgi:hypothetical protein